MRAPCNWVSLSLLLCLIAISSIHCIIVELPGTLNGSCVICRLQLADNFLKTCDQPCDDKRGLKSVPGCFYERSYSPTRRCEDFSVMCFNTYWNTVTSKFTDSITKQCKSRHVDYTIKEEQMRVVLNHGVYQFTCTNQRTVLGTEVMNGLTRPACVRASRTGTDSAILTEQTPPPPAHPAAVPTTTEEKEEYYITGDSYY